MSLTLLHHHTTNVTFIQSFKCIRGRLCNLGATAQLGNSTSCCLLSASPFTVCFVNLGLLRLLCAKHPQCLHCRKKKLCQPVHPVPGGQMPIWPDQSSANLARPLDWMQTDFHQWQSIHQRQCDSNVTQHHAMQSPGL